MASVAVPMVTSFAIGKVGEAMDLDPRLIGVAKMAGGFGAGQAYSSYAGANAINSANAANSTVALENSIGQMKWNDANLGNIASNKQLAFDKENFFKSGNFAAGKTNPAGISPKVIDHGFKPKALPNPLREDTTFGEQWGKDIDRWTTPKEGEQFSAADNLGAEMLSTLMQDPEKKPVPSGGGMGGGPSAPAFQGGGGRAKQAIGWFRNNSEGYKPQGI